MRETNSAQQTPQGDTMNRTQTIKAHKLSAGMVEALTSAQFNPNAHGPNKGAYTLMSNVHPRTRKALHDRGMMHGHYYLTREGVITLTALVGNTLDMSGYEWDGDMIIPAAPSVTVEGGEPNTWAPEFDAPGASECYFGCGSPVVAVFVDYVGRTEGLCAAHRDRVEGQTYDVPVSAETDAQSVSEVQEENTMDSHVIIPGVNALDMGERSYNRFVGIGESQGVPGSLFTYGLATAISLAPGMNGTGKVNIPCEFGDVITVRTSLGDKRYVVQDNRYSATGPRKGDPILTPYTTDDAKCYVCQTHGDNSLPGQNIDGEWVCGFCVANECSPRTLDTHSLTFYVETERAGTKYECGNCGCIDTRSNFARYECAGETLDAGFVETDSQDDYAIVSRLTTGAGFHTVEESESATPAHTVTTGTTTHTLDTNGEQWTHFDHVLNLCDVVKVVGMQGVYEVHCLIPGLPVVYVLGTQGEPFPVDASKVYAL